MTSGVYRNKKEEFVNKKRIKSVYFGLVHG